MKRALTILLMLLTLTLWGAEQGGARVQAHRLELGEKYMLYSYTYLGIEVRPLTDEEFEAMYKELLIEVPEGVHHVELSTKIGERVQFSPFWKQKVGLVITKVVPGSPAEKGGLVVGDILHDICASEMKTPDNLLCSMRNTGPGVPLHMWLIDKNLCWKHAMPRCTARPEPVAVGHIVPLKLCPQHRAEVDAHQKRAIELMAQDNVDMVELCMHLESISRLLYKGYTPGCLRLPLRSGECSITVTRNWWDVDVIMVEDGVETRGSLKRWVVTPRSKFEADVADGPRVLPEAIRARLREIDTTGADKAPVYEPNSTGCPIPKACCR